MSNIVYINGVYANMRDAKINIDDVNRDRLGIYIGITEHGNVETENEIHDLYQNNLDTSMFHYYMDKIL